MCQNLFSSLLRLLTTFLQVWFPSIGLTKVQMTNKNTCIKQFYTLRRLIRGGIIERLFDIVFGSFARSEGMRGL